MKTREEQIEQNFQNIKNGSLIFAWDFDPHDTPLIVVAKKENDKIYAKIKETNSGAIVLDGYRKQSDYKRITMREFAGVTGDNIYNRLAELEDKIESGELIERTSEEYSAVRKQAVEEFAEKLRDKRFFVKIGSRWFAVVKSRDIKELVKEVCGE